MSEDVMLREAIQAIADGQRARARDLLTRLLHNDQNNPDYWIWMSAVVDAANERIYCLETALRLDPTNQAAMRGLVLLGARPPADNIVMMRPVRRKWGGLSAEDKKTKPQGFWANLQDMPLRKAVPLFGGVILVIILIIGSFTFIPNVFRKPVAMLPTSTPRPWRTPTASATFTATPTLVVRTATPTFIGATPLWMLLKATYTPAPVYINTPHTISEAYRAGMRAYARGDYTAMLNFMKQAIQMEPDKADTMYYAGEANRLMGKPKDALPYYDQAIKANASFAPAYVGRALANLAIDPQTDVKKDLDKAIDLDANLADAYVARAAFFIQMDNPEDALADLKSAEDRAPWLGMIYVYRAQAYLKLDQPTDAVASAEQAYQVDQTILPVYYTLAEAYAADNQPGKALPYIAKYLVYDDENAQAWLLMAQLQYMYGNDYKQARTAASRALELDNRLDSAYYYRAMTYIAEKKGQDAVNDLATALRFGPKNWDYNLAMVQALMLSDRMAEAYKQILAVKDLAETDEQNAAVYYYRGQLLEALSSPVAAAQDWQALLDLPKGIVSDAWLKTAAEHLQKLFTATPTQLPPTRTPTVTSTLKPTATPTVPPTQKPSATPTAPGGTPTPTPKSSATKTPSPTPKPSSTATPKVSPTGTPTRKPY